MLSAYGLALADSGGHTSAQRVVVVVLFSRWLCCSFDVVLNVFFGFFVFVCLSGLL